MVLLIRTAHKPTNKDEDRLPGIIRVVYKVALAMAFTFLGLAFTSFSWRYLDIASSSLVSVAREGFKFFGPKQNGGNYSPILRFRRFAIAFSTSICPPIECARLQQRISRVDLYMDILTEMQETSVMGIVF